MRAEIGANEFKLNFENTFKNKIYCNKPDLKLKWKIQADDANDYDLKNCYNYYGVSVSGKDHDCYGLLSEMSQDQAYRLLMGFALINTQVDANASYNGYNFTQKAQLYATKIIKWIRNSHQLATPAYNMYHKPHEFVAFGATHPWTIVSPVTGLMVYRGSQAELYSTPIAKYYKLWNSQTYYDAYAIKNRALWNNTQINHIVTNAFGAAMAPCIATISALGVSFALNVVHFQHSDNEIFLEICASLSHGFINLGVNVTQKELDLRASITGLEFYPLLHGVLHNKNTWIPQSTFRSQLDDAPACGPFCNGKQSPLVPDINNNTTEAFGWNTKNRFDFFKWERDGSGGNTYVDASDDAGEFSGLDYMLYFNLYNLYFSKYDANNSNTPFFNKMDYKSSANFPHQFLGSFYVGTTLNPFTMEAFNSITYTGTISTNNGHVGNVTMHAGNDIELKNGVHIGAGQNQTTFFIMLM